MRSKIIVEALQEQIRELEARVAVLEKAAGAPAEKTAEAPEKTRRSTKK